MLTASIFSLPDPGQNIWQLWGCQEEPNADGDLYARNAASVFDNHTSAWRLQTAIELDNPTLGCCIYLAQLANGTSGAQIPTHGRRSNHPVDDILTPAANDLIDEIRAESDDDAETRHPNPTSFLMTTPGSQSLKGSFKEELSGSSDT